MRKARSACHWVPESDAGSATQGCRDCSAKEIQDGLQRVPDTVRIRQYHTTVASADSIRFLAAFTMVHAAVFAYGFLQYDFKVFASHLGCKVPTDSSQSNLAGARSTFGITYPIARASALVLHFDVALVLFRWLSLGMHTRSALKLTVQSCLSYSYFVGAPDATEWSNAAWYLPPLEPAVDCANDDSRQERQVPQVQVTLNVG